MVLGKMNLHTSSHQSYLCIPIYSVSFFFPFATFQTLSLFFIILSMEYLAVCFGVFFCKFMSSFRFIKVLGTMR